MTHCLSGHDFQGWKLELVEDVA